MDSSNVLRDVGLSEREVKVYTALLGIGETTVGPLAASTRMQHSKVYQTLDKLLDKGLVSYVFKGKVKYFSPLSPRHLLKMLKEKERALNEVIPSLEKKQEASKSPQITRVYEGYEAIKAMFESILESMDKKSYYYVFAFKEEYPESSVASRFLRNVHQELEKKNVTDKLIANIGLKREVLKNYKGNKNMQLRFTKQHLPPGVMVIDDQVINWTWGKRPTAIQIVSEQIATEYKKFFEEIWKTAKK